MGSKNKLKAANFYQLIFLLILIAAGSYLVWHALQVSVPTIGVVFERTDGRTGQFELELAVTEAERGKGMMFRRAEDVAPNTGMLFVFPNEAPRKFWMRNTYVSLDMIFLDGQLKVVGVVADVPILNDEQRGVDRPSQYVVELPAGTAARERITAGAKLVPVSGAIPVAAR